MHRTETANVLVIGTGAAGWRAAIAATQAGVAGAACSASARSSTPTPCSPRAASTPRSGRATRRTRGSSTSPTPCARATSSAIRGWSRSWRASRRPPCSSSPTGAASSRAPRTAPRPALLRRPPLAAHLLRRRLHGPRHPAHGRARRAPSSASASRRTSTSRGCSSPTAPASARSPSTCTPASGPSTSPMPSSWRPAATPGSGGGARRGATRTTATGMRLALDAGCRLMDMELVQFHPTGMVSPEEAPGRW